ncbi:DUF4158 domain-containing protein [Protofrankia symbiont of Coriaria ruscifolia]|uniref:DUF4158 domain-containing protein n=1 Tax=Protofrankia symbiont of Coriaria ruscifolia TaxID=1306542 RepID=UPI003242D474
MAGVASIDRTAYPRFKRMVSGRELVEAFSPTADEFAWARGKTQNDQHLLALVVRLKSYQRLGYFPKPPRASRAGYDDAPRQQGTGLLPGKLRPVGPAVRAERSSGRYAGRRSARAWLLLHADGDLDGVTRRWCGPTSGSVPRLPGGDAHPGSRPERPRPRSVRSPGGDVL